MNGNLTNTFAPRAAARRLGLLALASLLCTLSLGGPAIADEASFVTLDAPDAGTTPGVTPLPQGTFPYQVNNDGEVGGNYQDANNAFHGFLRTRDGEFIEFNAPGAGTGPFQGTQGFAISPRGIVIGKTIDANYTTHGMLRTRDGDFQVFDAPGAGHTPSPGPIAIQGTIALNVNSKGVIAGNYIDANNTQHAIVRATDGTITNIDPPVDPPNAVTFASPFGQDCLTEDGRIVGGYSDATGTHGFLRTPDGHYTNIDVEGAVGGTVASGINEEGSIVGGYIDANGVNHGFLRAPEGRITLVDVPTAGAGAGQGTIINYGTINAAGEVSGDYMDTNGVFHGFVRDRHGAYTTFDAPAASAGGTEAISNNDAGAITGYYPDASGRYHGFLRTGRRCPGDRVEDGQSCGEQ